MKKIIKDNISNISYYLGCFMKKIAWVREVGKNLKFPYFWALFILVGNRYFIGLNGCS